MSVRLYIVGVDLPPNYICSRFFVVFVPEWRDAFRIDVYDYEHSGACRYEL